MSLGGINNPALIGASQREARSKLDVMAGIKRPQGIMASSPQLMQAAMPMPAAPMPMPPAPMPMPPVQPTLPQMPMNTAVAPMVPAPRSLNPMAPAVPTVPQPASPTTPMNFQEAGPVAVNPQFEGYSKMGAEIGDRARASVAAGGSSTVDITMDAASFMKKLLGELPGDIQQNLLDQHGDPAGVEKAVATTATNIEDALETEDPAKVSAAALKALDVPDTEEARLDVANTFGFDTSNIAALDDKIMEVLMAGRATDFQQAVLVGLQNYKSTAMARASGLAAKSGMSPLEPFADAVRDLAGKIINATGDPDVAVAMQKASDALRPYYSDNPTTVSTPDRSEPEQSTQMPNTPGTRFKDNQTGKIMVVGKDGVPREE